MTYEHTLDFLYKRHTSTYRGLQRIRYVLEKLGNPQDMFPSVLITGTNGKGSTAKMLNSILIEAGYRVGCFTSPHLLEFGERITINREYIPKEDVIELTELIRTGPLVQLEKDRKELQIEGIVSFFEIVTAMGFLHFVRQHVDLAILEVGIGGRLDATNTVNPLISIITNVDLDHQQILGTTVTEIAQEKSAIIREHGIAVTGCQKPEALAVLQEVCRQKQAAIYRTGIVYDEEQSQFLQYVLPQELFSSGSLFAYHGIHHRVDQLQLSLIGEHQLANAAVALATLDLLEQKGFGVAEIAIRSGLAHVNHPGRLELLSKHPRVVVDIAHNSMGSAAIAKTLTTVFSYRRLILVIGVLHDKDVKGILGPLLNVADVVIFTSPHNTQRAEAASATAKAAEELVQATIRRIYEHWLIVEYIEKAIKQACELAGEEDLICVTGSNYTVSEAELYFCGKK
ncbi:MAG: folylpolyglutamate synthase/dihydrofolate synthase family protein [Candidatus Vecturithrix sp.]|jgi:dihydrofolate synthase/folylpolyglutamate synthase|nr:folylpolyglutamate synthase/dihydrofolate synthase family protein [Candidatus Vecturithrix sp.]